MPAEEKHKINVWIPGSLWKQVGSLGHENTTKATIAAFEALVLQGSLGNNKEALGSSQEALGSNQEELRKLQEEIGRYQEKVHDLQNRPDLVTYAQLQARLEGLQEIVKEKDRSIERLENDLKKADLDKEDLKQMHNNYFLQVQTLINQKAIGSPKEQKKTVKEEKPAQKEKPIQKTDKPTEKAEKTLMEKICKGCNQPFFTENPRKETCSDSCRQKFSRENKKK